MLPDIESRSVEPRNMVFRTYRDSTILSTQNLVPEILNQYQAPYLVINRADLVDVLVKKAASLGITIILDSLVTKYDFLETAVVISGRDSHQADLIVGCDGARSASREALLERADPPYSSGVTVFRLSVSLDRLRQDPDLEHLVKCADVNIWFGPGAHAVCYPLEHNGLLNFVLTADQSETTCIVAPQETSPQELSQIFRSWDPVFVKLFEMATGMRKWTLLETSELHDWTHSSGTFTLLGDSAHAALPYL